MQIDFVLFVNCIINLNTSTVKSHFLDNITKYYIYFVVTKKKKS